MKRHYSGDKSIKFWRAIAEFSGTPRHDALYKAGCDLQNLEQEVLKAIKKAKEEKAKKTRYKSKKK